MKIEWNEVTRLSQTVAILLFAAVFFAGFFIGRKYEKVIILGKPINTVVFACAEGKQIPAEFYAQSVHLKITEGDFYLPQVVSGSGARYADASGSFVFWNKGDTASITRMDTDGLTLLYKDCKINQ